MPCAIRWDAESGVVFAHCEGSLTQEDAKRCAEEYWRNHEWSGRPVLWDLRDARLEVKGSDVRDIARFVLDRQPENPPKRVAFVAARDPEFGLARMFEAYREHPSTEVRIFRDLEEAVTWVRTETSTD